MVDNKTELAEARIRGRIVEKSKLTRTLDAETGTYVQRFVVERFKGPASRPVRMGLYIKGEFAKRCGLGLHLGDTIEGWGDIGSTRDGMAYAEVIVEDGNIKLRERAKGATA